LRTLLENGTLTQIVDVRTPNEATSTGHLPGARFVDFFASNFLDSIKHLKFDPARPCLIYCALGGRSRRVAVQLAAHGFTHLIILEGGLDEWQRTGAPVEGGRRPAAP
jgi:rhodanese-related sulfurtransferase